MIVNTAPKDKYDFGSVHDALIEIEGWQEHEFTDEQINAICNVLPESIQLNAAQWGWNDTEVRDSVFVWARDHQAEVESAILSLQTEPLAVGDWPFPTEGNQ